MSLPYWLKSLILAITFLTLYSCNTEKQPEDTSELIEIREAKFLGSESCKSCHQSQFREWKGSHHEQAMKVADSTSILADFNNTSITIKGIKSSFFKKKGNFYVNTQGPDGTYNDYKIVYTFGVIPLQQYLVEFPDGAYQCLITAWDNEKKEWYDLQPNLEIKHDEWMHWSGGSMRWNSMCADCHSTNLKKNFDSETLKYNTTFSEINVGCESCHGPSSLHADFYKQSKKGTPPSLFMDKTLTSKALVEKCARCHSRRSALTKSFDFKGHFLDHYNPSLLTAPNYEADGQIKDEDYVYGSFVQSKMYHNGVSCKDCHNVHSLELKAKGNALCLNCHTPNYNSPEHHFHEVDTKGAQCVNCHMPGKNYMGIDFRRDHSLRVPRPDQSVKHGTPNACNNCHTDKSPKWARGHIIKNHGGKRQDHFSDYLLEGSVGNKTAYFQLLKDSKSPEIARATALRELSNQQLEQNEVNAILEYLNDSSPLVRNEAVGLLGSRNGFTKYLKPLTMDSIRLVRLSAAQTLKVNSTELREQLDMNSDFAAGQHQLGLYYEMNNNPDFAIKSYQRAITIDNYFNASRMNLALLFYKQGNINEAEKLYLKVQELEPNFDYSYYMLGLLYNEMGDSEKALIQLEMATKKNPKNEKAIYNYILKLQETGNQPKAEATIKNSLLLFPKSEPILYLKLINELNSSNFSAAENTCQKLIVLVPKENKYKKILLEIQASK